MYEKSILDIVKYELDESPLLDLELSQDQIIITAKDEPPPKVGQYFVLIYPYSRTVVNNASSVPNYVEDRFYFNVVCGARTRLAPTDRLSYYLNTEYQALAVIKDIVITIVSKLQGTNNNAIKAYIQSNLSHYPAAVTTLLHTSIDIIGGFQFLSADAEPVPKFPDYFTSTDLPESQSLRPAGHTYTCRFAAPSRIYSTQC
jgi:hypothetical protein